MTKNLGSFHFSVIHAVGFNIRPLAVWQQQFSASHPDMSPSLRGKEAFSRDLTALTTGTGETTVRLALELGDKVSFLQVHGYMGNGGYMNPVAALLEKKGKWSRCR